MKRRLFLLLKIQSLNISSKVNAAYTLPVRQTVSTKVDVLYDNKLEFLKVSI